MKFIQRTSIIIKYDLVKEPIPPIHKDDLVMIGGDTYKVYEICKDELFIWFKLELYARAINFYCFVDNELRQLTDYRS